VTAPFAGAVLARRVVSAALLCAALPAAVTAEQDPLLATVNGRQVHRSDVQRQVEALALGDQITVRAQFDRFAESVVREEILFQYLRAEDFDTLPGLRDAVRTAALEFLIRHGVRTRIDVTDEEVRAYYDANASAIRGESVRAAHIVLARRDQCEALARGIDSDEAFRDAARARSLDRESAARGGDIGLFMNHAGPYGFETALFTMQPGDMQVFETGRGCHLVRITGRETPPLPPLADVAPRIRTLLETGEERALLDALLERARATIDVQRAAPAR